MVFAISDVNCVTSVHANEMAFQHIRVSWPATGRTTQTGSTEASQPGNTFHNWIITDIHLNLLLETVEWYNWLFF